MAARKPLVQASGEQQQLQAGDTLVVDTTITTASTELILEETGDVYGAIRLKLQNRDFHNGVIIENATLDILDLQFMTGTGANQTIRFEHRSANLLLSGNTAGEWQIGPAGSPNQIFGAANSRVIGTLQSDSHFGAITAATDGATVTFDLAVSDKQKVTLGGNRTLAVSNAQIGQTFSLILIQDGTGGRAPTWFSGITWMTAGGAVPALSSAAGKINVFTFLCVGSGAYYGFLSGQNG